MSKTLITGPAAYPVSLAEAKEQCELRAARTDHDTKLTSMIKQATGYVEQVIGQDLVERTWRQNFDRFPSGGRHIELGKYPVQSVTSITYTDVNASPQQQTLATSVWGLDAGMAPSIIYLKYNQSWPSATVTHNSIAVTFVTGYAPAGSPIGSPPEYAENVPDEIRGAILMVVADLFEHREANLDTQTYENKAVENFLAAHRIHSL